MTIMPLLVAAHQRLTAGQAYAYDVRIKNSGDVPEEYFIDARQPGSTTLDLAPVGGPGSIVGTLIAAMVLAVVAAFFAASRPARSALRP